ncbi:MAG: helix-turn-helix transcriptional regulator [Lachnospiraceae bacterium]|nr:helix-turn-helix transcriptional regulator [Lachnospiraceae bacterium]
MDENMGKRLKELRKGKLTQEQLAQYLEVDQTMITKLENGTRSFNSGMIDKLCVLFGCTEEYLLGESEEYIPLNFAFRSNNIQTEDLESIAAINKIVMNIREMNKLMGDE